MKKCIAQYLLAISVVAFCHKSLCDTLIANDIPVGATRNILTVGAGKTFSLYSAVISVGLCGGYNGIAVRQRILKSGQPITHYVSVSDSFQLTFDPAITYRAGQVIAVQNAHNGGLACVTNFLLQGKMTP